MYEGKCVCHHKIDLTLRLPCRLVTGRGWRSFTSVCIDQKWQRKKKSKEHWNEKAILSKFLYYRWELTLHDCHLMTALISSLPFTILSCVSVLTVTGLQCLCRQIQSRRQKRVVGQRLKDSPGLPPSAVPPLNLRSLRYPRRCGQPFLCFSFLTSCALSESSCSLMSFRSRWTHTL